MVAHLSAHCSKLQRLSLHDSAAAAAAAARASQAPRARAVNWAPLAALPCLSSLDLLGAPAHAAGAAAALAGARARLKHLRLEARGVAEEDADAITRGACALPVLSWLSLSLLIQVRRPFKPDDPEDDPACRLRARLLRGLPHTAMDLDLSTWLGNWEGREEGWAE
ncbi:hypothetical protein MNEG_1994 [Monoraphidium neglectum]|jgi:hypothetical protein|uniref:Uncharacterized protein n=1 Tax=Monoraphidium neglectum TaxID=145388 RepID=A0A0D2LHJ7_9CHLO|nr:hypothetical protein MNEG_1994 [Monoraphidium neglectum]KIZ05969.1 hypothetical protein MNEG_1994 [Monoraphidium neglectum]|eukprot:XP_013904988.1 hypothetical protein MNEG_1994 [Monoraphidium neglectum]